ncbi:MAG TPA: hypothetical protein VF996_02770 [Candidatus Saccharimonadales bacterium]|jgi:hypothetical protein
MDKPNGETFPTEAESASNPNVFDSPEIRTRASQLAQLIAYHQVFQKSVSQTTENYARLKDTIRPDRKVESPPFAREWTVDATQDGIELFKSNHTIIRERIAELTDQEPLYQFEFKEPISDDMARSGELKFLAEDLIATGQGLVSLVNRSEDTSVILPVGVSFRIVIVSRDNDGIGRE